MLPTICPSPLMFTAFLIVSGVIYLMYVKTKQELRCNEKCKESELKTAINIARGKRPKTTGGRATFCLAIMFTVYLITQLPTYVYNLIQHTAALIPQPPLQHSFSHNR